MVKGLVIAALSLALGPEVDRTAQPWEQLSSDDGITVWQRHLDGSPYYELRAEAEMPYPSRELWNVLNDVEHYGEFMPYVVQARVLRRITTKRQIEYHLRAPPWVHMRDYALDVTLESHPEVGLYVMTWKTANQYAPPQPDGVVRIERLEGFWLLEPISPTRTRVLYQNLTSSDGSLPAVAIRYANRTGLRGIVAAVRDRAARMHRTPKD